MTPDIKGKMTFRIAGIFFLLSALLEIISLTAEVPLLGATRGGMVTTAYHLIYFVLFMALGIGLWSARIWAYKLVFAATLVYTVDKAQYLLFPKSMEAGIRQHLSKYQDIGQLFDIGAILQIVTLLTLLFIACWWGFAFYTYWRRNYFRMQQKPDTTVSSNQTGT
jgi:hypothetical protein